MAPRTHQPSEKPADEEKNATEELAWVNMLHSRIDSLVLETAEHRRMIESLILPLLRVHQPEDGQERIKPLRRRSQDEMDQALRRLLTGEPRPRDDDSPQVMQDAIAEVIALRQLTHDLMQALTTGYQHGLAAIRDMTSR